ncbi:hypothetical protein OIU79_013341 [Salix purpurea]|uniref:Uncharacterized protein n=2 Tax=Salix TaxID=40685 RepID=A0A9Q0Q5F7_SALPP|nr:hypothetical protein OIU79_013341 [Salix purpurea]
MLKSQERFPSFIKKNTGGGKMDAGMQVALPILGVLAAAAATFYVVSFSELRERSGRVRGRRV